MSRVAMPAKYSQYPKIIAIFLISPYSTLNQTELRFLYSQKSFKQYMGWLSFPGALPHPPHWSVLYIFFISVSPLPCIWQTETCFSSAYQSPITSQFRHGESPEEASSLLGRNYPPSLVSKHSLPSRTPWVCPGGDSVPECSRKQLHLLCSMESLSWNCWDQKSF